MNFSKALAGIALAAGVLSTAAAARADKPADDFLNPQDPGGRLTLMAIIGPGFRANYDHRFELEQDITELRTQLIADMVFPYSEVSANVDLRLFLLTFGGSVGYHNEWNLLQFQPDYRIEQVGANQVAPGGLNFGLDLAGQQQYRSADPRPESVDPNFPRADGVYAGPYGYSDLTREARQVKNQNTDVMSDRWAYYEGRLGFIWPAQNFLMSSTAALRFNDRPDHSFDWANATVMNGGMHLRWETYAFFRHPKIGFLGPALRVMNVGRNRLQADGPQVPLPANAARFPDGSAVPPGTPSPTPTVLAGAACQRSAPAPLDCREEREWEFHYGIIGGIRTNWVNSNDVFLMRVFTTYGMDDDELFGTHLFGMPLQLLFAYSVDVEF